MSDLFEVNSPPPRPHSFIQWKGTEVCLDFYCRCGADGHFDGMFAYNLCCPSCGTVWEMPIYLVPREGLSPNEIVRDLEVGDR